MITICPKCGKEFENNTNRKFCTRSCANSHIPTEEQNKRRSLKLKGNNFPNKGPKRAGELSHQRKMKRLVKAKNGQILNITYQQLEDYKKTHFVCEICGQAERASHNKKKVSELCRDHDHNTCKFRGLLCSNCNRKLGWFESYKNEIIKYLNKC